MTQSRREIRYPKPVDQRCPQKVERVHAEYQTGPADGTAAQSIFLEPQ